MDAHICNAIMSRSIVELNYDKKTILVEPYLYGLSTKGQEVVKVYQISSMPTEEADKSGWKILQVAKISDWKTTTDCFLENRAGYSVKDENIFSLICSVSV